MSIEAISIEAMAVAQKWINRSPRYRRGRGASPRDGTTHYIWRIRPQDLARTRPGHLRLNGNKFRWDTPPVVDMRTGERGHPGMDKHCRCYAEPADA